jgi:hypothetical protein
MMRGFGKLCFDWIMVTYRDLFWGTSRDPVGFKNFVEVDIMVVVCPLQDCGCISMWEIMMLFIFNSVIYSNIVIMIIFQNSGHIKLVTV